MTDTPDTRPCLHCILMDAIYDYWEEHGQPTSDGQGVHADITYTIAKTAEVLASLCIDDVPAGQMRETCIRDAHVAFEAALQAKLTGEPVPVELGIIDWKH